MANSLNVTTLLGYVGRDPKYFPPKGDMQSMATFSLGVEYYSKKTKTSELDWFDIKVYGSLAEYVNRYVRKNRKFGATGRLQNRVFDKEGIPQYRVELVADHIVPCDNKIPDSYSSTNENVNPITNNTNNIPTSNTTNDIPF